MDMHETNPNEISYMWRTCLMDVLIQVYHQIEGEYDTVTHTRAHKQSSNINRMNSW